MKTEAEVQAELDKIEDEIFSSDLPDNVLNDLLEMIQTRKQMLDGQADKTDGLTQLLNEVKSEFDEKKAQKEAQPRTMSFGDDAVNDVQITPMPNQNDMMGILNAEAQQQMQEQKAIQERLYQMKLDEEKKRQQ